MVLFTLLGLYAFLQRERKQVDSTHSGQDENMEQRDDEDEDDVSSLETSDGE